MSRSSATKQQNAGKRLLTKEAIYAVMITNDDRLDMVVAK
jgi:hypothetical protein